MDEHAATWRNGFVGWSLKIKLALFGVLELRRDRRQQLPTSHARWMPKCGSG